LCSFHAAAQLIERRRGGTAWFVQTLSAIAPIVLNKYGGYPMATKKRTFISFDYDHDLALKNLLVGQAKNPDTPFDIADFSIKEVISKDWKDKARTRIKGCDVLIVICGQYTNSASGVSTELSIAQEEEVPYFLLAGYSDKGCVKPTAALYSDKMYDWTWDNLKALINGQR
jgi:hypothetical protein